MPEKTLTKKRKRNDPPTVKEPEKPSMDSMEIFRRHFESQFEPLKDVKVAEISESEDDNEDSDGDWDGFPDVSDKDAEKKKAPGVIEFKPITSLTGDGQLLASKREMKSFMSSKPPSILPGSAKPAVNEKNKKACGSEDSDEDPHSEAANLKNDLALQRLLRESHLLSSASDNLEATGKNRLKAIESRIQALGGKDLTGHKIPMKMRQGINSGKKYRDEKRKREAKEAGIILEKEVKVKKVERKRDRGFGPSIGRFKGGALVLSKKDVREIEGGSGGGGKGGKGVKRRKK
ncbi:pre-rRNA processing and 40S ribosomal subunit assembly [Rhizina undulata]